MRKLLVVACLSFAFILGNASHAAAGDPLFVSMTTDDPFHSITGIGFAARQQAQGNAITVFLNDKAVVFASKAHRRQYADQQKVLDYIVRRGGRVIVCLSSMKHFGIKESDLLPGVKVGNADVIGAALFAENSRTLSW